MLYSFNYKYVMKNAKIVIFTGLSIFIYSNYLQNLDDRKYRNYN